MRQEKSSPSSVYYLHGKKYFVSTEWTPKGKQRKLCPKTRFNICKFKKEKATFMRKDVAYILGELRMMCASHVLAAPHVAVQCIAPRQVVSRAKTGSRQDKVSSSPGRLQIQIYSALWQFLTGKAQGNYSVCPDPRLGSTMNFKMCIQIWHNGNHNIKDN